MQNKTKFWGGNGRLECVPWTWESLCGMKYLAAYSYAAVHLPGTVEADMTCSERDIQGVYHEQRCRGHLKLVSPRGNVHDGIEAGEVEPAGRERQEEQQIVEGHDADAQKQDLVGGCPCPVLPVAFPPPDDVECAGEDEERGYDAEGLGQRLQEDVVRVDPVAPVAKPSVNY